MQTHPEIDGLAKLANEYAFLLPHIEIQIRVKIWENLETHKFSFTQSHYINCDAITEHRLPSFPADTEQRALEHVIGYFTTAYAAAVKQQKVPCIEWLKKAQSF